MPDAPYSPDFDQIAMALLKRVIANVPFVEEQAAAIAEQLRLVWNARGAADVDEVTDTDERVAIRALDR